MCRTIQSLIQTVICALQMITRIFMTVLLMIENMIRMLLQSIYNFISTILQIISLIPICCIFMLTAKMRCLLCGGGGGGCGGGGGGGFVGCFLSVIFFIFLFKALRHYGLADKFMARLGYSRVWKYEGKTFTAPPSPDFLKTSPNVTTTPKPSGRMGPEATDEDIKNYIFDDFESSTTTAITTLQIADTYAATEYSKIGNLSTTLYYLF
ncbi:PREDICTED: uncharacterized protein LOC106125220 [Papilio xuthus]|uniref:Uncharacterized protein LOC106125220 n=1 Tax=Papilio xuthus TaxID=66420 RepID=A0AAJ6ZRC4_PAPXU|nr:PREDICTED: uncharacterized protein LOC106125220 [Papilio xuthus]